MRVNHSARHIQLYSRLLLLFCPIIFFACTRFSDTSPVMPPSTNPLARQYIGFGVVNVSFAHVLNEPGLEGISQGHLRRGTVVRIIERRQIINRGLAELWVLAEGNYQENTNISRGWLQETSLEIYNSERRANTASRRMIQ